MRDNVCVLGVWIDRVTMAEAVQALAARIADKQSCLVATANAEMVMMAQKDGELAAILNQADLVVPDGAGVVWAARYQGEPMPERVAGYDLSQRLLELAARNQYRVYLFGGAPGIVDKAGQYARQRYPGLQIVGMRHGYFDSAAESGIIADIQARRPDILLAALGVPKQEKWLHKYRAELQTPVVMGVGGSFDVMAGQVKRAPLWMQRANIEWLFRLLSQPQRAIRMLALPRFVWRVVRDKKY